VGQSARSLWFLGLVASAEKSLASFRKLMVKAEELYNSDQQSILSKGKRLFNKFETWTDPSNGVPLFDAKPRLLSTQVLSHNTHEQRTMRKWPLISFVPMFRSRQNTRNTI
jgi:hypothetical protein